MTALFDTAAIVKVLGLSRTYVADNLTGFLKGAVRAAVTIQQAARYFATVVQLVGLVLALVGVLVACCALEGTASAGLLVVGLILFVAGRLGTWPGNG